MSAIRLIAAGAAALSLLGASASTARQSADAPAGEGVICAVLLFSLAAEVGRRCDPAPSAEIQAELESSVARLDAYVLANSPGMTAADLRRLKVDQAGLEMETAQLCAAGRGLAEGLSRVPVEELRQSVDEMVARPGQPTLGSCV